MNRGDRHEDIFLDAQDRQRFTQILAQACSKTGWQIHAFCLMRDHFQFVVETPQPNLMTGMKWLLGTYTQQFNKRRKLSGHVFGGRYRARLVDGSGDYLRAVCEQVHWSPVRENLVTPLELMHSFAWSSVPLYLAPAHRRPPWLRVDRVMAQCGISPNDAAGGEKFIDCLQTRGAHTDAAELTLLKNSSGVGDAKFRQKLLELASPGAGVDVRHSDLSAATASQATQANEIIEEELRRLGIAEDELIAKRKGNPDKIDIALRLREQTTVTLTWIADRLRMGTTTHLAHLIYWRRRREREARSVRPAAVATRPEPEPGDNLFFDPTFD